MAEVFGYDKFSEITSEVAIRKTFCDLAIKINDEIKLLLEVKAIGMNLKDQHIKQAQDYGANSGIEWVVLTNGINWKVYRLVFGRPISAELVFELDMLTVSPKKQADLELLFYLSREAVAKNSKASLDSYAAQKQAVNKVVISQILLSDAGVDFVRKALRKVSADAKPTPEEIKQILADEVIKRDALDDEGAAAAKRKVAKALKPIEKVKAEKEAAE